MVNLLSEDPHPKELTEMEQMVKEIEALDSSNETKEKEKKEKEAPKPKEVEDEKIIWSDEPFDDDEFTPEEYK